MIELIQKKINHGFLYKAALFLFIYGFLTIPLSTSLGLSDLVVSSPFSPKGKQVGYLSALNWWPVFTILIPSLLITLGYLLKTINRTHFRLIKNGMILDPNTREIINSVDVINDSWSKWLKSAIKLWLLLATFAILYSYFEFITTSLLPTLYPDPDPSNIKEVDWSIAPLFSEVSNISNGVFNFVAFTMQAIGVSLALLMLCVSGAYGAFINQYSHTDSKWILIPNIKSNDPRKGFESFEEVGSILLVLGLIAYLIIYLSILQNTYLDSSALNLIGGKHGFLNANIKDAFSIVIHFNQSTAIGLMLGLIVVIITLAVVPGIILRSAAKKAKINYEDIHRNENINLLNNMKWWPYSGFKTNILITTIIFCLIGLFFPSITPHIASVIGVAVITYVIFKINNFFSTEST